MTQPLVYSVKQGDTLWGISRETGIEINSLARFNNLHGCAAHHLSIGQLIKLPGHGWTSRYRINDTNTGYQIRADQERKAEARVRW